MDNSSSCGISFDVRANIEPSSGRSHTFGSHYELLKNLLNKMFQKEEYLKDKNINIYSLFFYRSQNFYTYTYSSYYLIEGIGYSDMKRLINKYNNLMSTSQGSIGILYADSSLDNRILSKIGEIKIKQER
jgi:hypothetical protein